MSNSTPLPPLDVVRHMLHYDEQAGMLFWENPDPQSRCKPGQRWGRIQKEVHTSSNGTKQYIQGRLCCRSFHAHRLIWFYVTGEDPGDLMVDHINGDGLDNHFPNLRLATRSQNLVNQAGHARRKSRYKNVTWVKRKNRWMGELRRSGVLHRTSHYASEEDAYAAVLELKKVIDGD
jgi:hypothetical protein